MSTPYELLIETLLSGERTAQAEAARLLGEAGVKQSAGPLLEYLDSCMQFHKSAGFTALGRIGDASVCDTVCQLINDPRMRDDWYWFGYKSVQAAGSHALLMLGDERGLKLLTQFADKGEDVFYTWFGPAILQLDDGGTGVAVAAGIKELKARLTVDAIFNVSMKSTRLSDPSRLTAAIEALGWIGGDEACNKIKEYVEHSSRFVRGQAALSLMKSKCNGDCKAVVEKLADEDETDFVKARAATALSDSGRLEAVVKKATDKFGKAVAIEGLGLIGAGDKAGLVTEMAGDEDGYVRQCVIEALERIGAKSAVSVAEDGLNDEAINVRCQAAKCLIVCGS